MTKNLQNLSIKSILKDRLGEFLLDINLNELESFYNSQEKIMTNQLDNKIKSLITEFILKVPHLEDIFIDYIKQELLQLFNRTFKIVMCIKCHKFTTYYIGSIHLQHFEESKCCLKCRQYNYSPFSFKLNADVRWPSNIGVNLINNLKF